MIDHAHVPLDPQWAARIRASFEQQGAMRLFDAKIGAIEPGRCIIELPYRDELAQQHGYFHAGITSAIADAAGSYAALGLFPPGFDALTVEFKINLFAPARGERLVAEASVVRSGRTLTICTVDICVDRNGARIPCGIMQQTLIRIDARESEVGDLAH